MTRKIVFRSLITAAAIAVTAPPHGAEAKSDFAIAVPDLLSRGSFSEQIQHNAVVSSIAPGPYRHDERRSVMSASTAFLPTAHGANGSCRTSSGWVCRPFPASSTKVWTLSGSALMVLGLLARRRMTSRRGYIDR